MNYIYRPAAATDIDRAYAWYEKERKGLGEEFLAEVHATARLVLARRGALIHRFPYGLFYRVLGDTVVFVACFHARRSPALWKRRS